MNEETASSALGPSGREYAKPELILLDARVGPNGKPTVEFFETTTGPVYAGPS